jgi:hypothetical protein
MGSIKHDSVKISHPTLQYGEQRDRTMLSSCAFTRSNLLHGISFATLSSDASPRLTFDLQSALQTRGLLMLIRPPRL